MDIEQYCTISKNAQYCPILPNIALCCSILLKWLFNIYHIYQSYDIVRTIVQNCQIYPIIVRHWLILFSTDQYCPLAPFLDISPLNLNQSHFKSDLDTVKNLLHVCKYAGMQEWNLQICNKEWKLGCHFLKKQSFCKPSIKSKSFFYKSCSTI